MTFLFGFAAFFVGVFAIAGLIAPTQEGRELYRTVAGVLGFWTILAAVLL